MKIFIRRGLVKIKPKTLILSGYGINCEEETKYAFELAGGEANIVHVNDVIDNYAKLGDYQILAFPGGFSYGDDTGSGKAFANKVKNNLFDDILSFVRQDKLVIGICNGFQILTNLGLLPAINGEYGNQNVALTHNTTARYECRWVSLMNNSNKCVFTKGISEIELPVAHGEGRFYAPQNILQELNEKNLVVFRYAKDGRQANGEFPHNPNGSLEDIAGICDESGRIFGLMPHPERYVNFIQHPLWTLKKEELNRNKKPLPEKGAGLQIFRNAVSYFG